MKKLGNKGWGLAEMLVLSGILLLALIIAAYLISNFYNNLTMQG